MPGAMPVDHTAGSWKQGKNVIPEPLELKSTIPSRNAVAPGRHLSRQAITVRSICRLRRNASAAVVTQAATLEYALGADQQSILGIQQVVTGDIEPRATTPGAGHGADLGPRWRARHVVSVQR